MHLFSRLEAAARQERDLSLEDAASALSAPDLSTDSLLELARIPREKHYGRRVRLHVLNNVRNGHCPEDCGYCAQRKTAAPGSIADYVDKSVEEILAEAKEACKNGAFRYCLVSAGRGPGRAGIARYASIIRLIKERYPLEVCLSAGILKDPGLARELAEAGLDRYNHNLNTSENHYGEICSTHEYADRRATLSTLRSAGVELCSGVIVGMGESPQDLADLAMTLRAEQTASIPVNFFLPVPGHAINEAHTLTADYCLRVLAMFRLANPEAEVRMAAGREMHIGASQPRALLAANSLFVSGYLNVRGSDAATTVQMIEQAGFEVDAAASDLPRGLPEKGEPDGVVLKGLPELRPFQHQGP